METLTVKKEILNFSAQNASELADKKNNVSEKLEMILTNIKQKAEKGDYYMNINDSILVSLKKYLQELGYVVYNQELMTVITW